MSQFLKIKLTLLAFCLAVVGASQLYVHAFDEGLMASDQEAFDSYVQFAQQMKRERHSHPAPRENVQASSIWDAVDVPSKKHR